MKHKGMKILAMLLTLAMVIGLMPGLSLTAYADNTETLLTSITTDRSVTITYSTAGCATLTTSGNVEASTVARKERIYGWTNSSPSEMGSLTVTPSEGYTITKVVFKGYDQDESQWFDVFTDTEAPYTCYMKSSEVSLSENMANSKIENIGQIDVYGYVTPTSTAVTGITLDPDAASMTVGGETLTLTPTVLPANATDKTVTWTTSDASVATVADGVVTAVTAGTATITATATNGTEDTSDDKTATCTVTVTDPLADAKTSAKADLDTLQSGKNQNDYDAADWTTLTQAITDGKTAIENATMTDAVATAKNTAVDAVNAVKTKAQKLADAKTTAKNDLDTLLGTKTESDYDAADWTTLTQAITDGKTAIENATTTDAVATAKNTAVDAVNAVKTKAQKALENAKTSAVNTVNAVNANDYIAADQQTVTDAKTTALAAIEATTTEEEVTTALNNFNNAIASCTTQVVADQIAQVMSEVSAKTGSGMTYTGSPIQLINTPTTALPTGYIMKYAVTTENTAPSDNLYTTSIPAKTEAGTYYVWYKAVGDANHSDSAPVCVTVTIAALTEPVITGYALELGGVLGLRYYMLVPDGFDATGAAMTFAMNNRENQVIPYSEIKADNQGKYFTCIVYAYQMADTITATFTYKKDGATKTLTDTYSVKQYLDSLKGGEYSGEALNLVKATRAYGHFIQPYLARVNGWTVGGKYAELDYTGAVDVDAAKTGSETHKFKLTEMDSDKVQSAQYRLLLNADTSFIVEVRLKETPADNVTMTIDGNEDKTTGSGTTYRVELGNIAANNLGVEHRVVMQIGGTTVFDFTASPLSYVYTVLSKSSPAEDEQYALASLYEYSQAADAYAGQS